MAVDWSRHASPLEKARRATEAEVRAGRLRSWVLDRQNGAETRDRHLNAIDRRNAFRVIRGGAFIGGRPL